MKFERAKLKNGLTVLHEKRDVPVTTVMLAAKFGSINETEKEKGMAHFMEHLCFKGTKKRTAKQIAEPLEKVGGNLNAFTSEEVTAYHVKLPSRHLDMAMDIIFDIFFNPTFPEEEVAKEANVICEEIKMYHDNPRAHAYDKIKGCLYDKPFGMSIAGSEENVRSMTRKQLLGKHDGIYCPENAILCVVGNNDFSEVVKFAEKFSVDRKTNEKITFKKISFRSDRKTESRRELQQASVAIGLHFPKMSDRERHVAEVFSAIFGEGMSSKLFTEVREKRGLVYTVRSDLDIGKEFGYMIIYAGTNKEKVDEVLKICLEEFSKMKDISDKELDDGKKQVIGSLEVESEDCANVALNLIMEEIAGRAENYYDFAKKVNAITLEDIKKIAAKTEYASYVLAP